MNININTNANMIYIHVCCINNYKEVFNNLIYCIKDSGLYDSISEIRCCILGDYDIELFKDEKIKIHKTSNHLSLYEVFTINKIHEDCKNEDMNVLYLHTKGITRNNDMNVNGWIDYMIYFDIYNYKKCLELLLDNDTVGVNLNEHPVFHYSGNFWWSKSSYIKKLNTCIYESYNSPEFWLTCNKNGKYVGLWKSNVNHYNVCYQKENYENKIIIPYNYDFSLL